MSALAEKTRDVWTGASQGRAALRQGLVYLARDWAERLFGMAPALPVPLRFFAEREAIDIERKALAELDRQSAIKPRGSRA